MLPIRLISCVGSINTDPRPVFSFVCGDLEEELKIIEELVWILDTSPTVAARILVQIKARMISVCAIMTIRLVPQQRSLASLLHLSAGSSKSITGVS